MIGLCTTNTFSQNKANIYTAINVNQLQYSYTLFTYYLEMT